MLLACIRVLFFVFTLLCSLLVILFVDYSNVGLLVIIWFRSTLSRVCIRVPFAAFCSIALRTRSLPLLKFSLLDHSWICSWNQPVLSIFKPTMGDIMGYQTHAWKAIHLVQIRHADQRATSYLVKWMLVWLVICTIAVSFSLFFMIFCLHPA